MTTVKSQTKRSHLWLNLNMHNINSHEMKLKILQLFIFREGPMGPFKEKSPLNWILIFIWVSDTQNSSPGEIPSSHQKMGIYAWKASFSCHFFRLFISHKICTATIFLPLIFREDPIASLRSPLTSERGQGPSQQINNFCKSVSHNSSMHLIVCPSNLSMYLEQLG